MAIQGFGDDRGGFSTGIGIERDEVFRLGAVSETLQNGALSLSIAIRTGQDEIRGLAAAGPSVQGGAFVL